MRYLHTCEGNLVCVHKVMRVLACSPGPLPNVPPYMVSMCGLVGASLSEPTFTV